MLEFDVILVPGGGVRKGGEIPPWIKRRLDLAIQLSHEEPIVTLSAGTVHRPPLLNKEGFPVFESLAAARYLISKGMDPQRIFTETCSYDTIGNAYFSRVIHVDPANFKRILVITSNFHMPRTESIFRWVFSLDTGVHAYQLFFDSVPDRGIPRDALRARQEKEKKSLAQFLKTQKKIHSLKELHHWLFKTHAAYSVSKTIRKARGEILKTY
ncbi:MAG: YdcF family protein [Candidatus Aminicenantes bacterium]|nr:YdcF family protein [Candidatus Aminicenantes bacterium]